MILKNLPDGCRAHFVAFVLGLSIFIPGCATPDLTPFADATAVLANGIRAGGDLALAPLNRQPIWNGTEFVRSDDPSHPSRPLKASWEIRRKTMDAVMIYSASLAAIADSARHRKANATELVSSVKELASAVPGMNVGAGPAGDLMISGLGILVGVKAWHDMEKAVRAADPAIQLIAKSIKKDLAALSDQFESSQRDQIIQKTTALRPVERFHRKLEEARAVQRAKIESNPSEASQGVELARVDTLVANVALELNGLRAERQAIEDSFATGKEFYASAVDAVDSWAGAHSDLARAFEENRRPNLVLLVARAQELNAIVQKLRN